jgi:hypothetical protein
LSLRRSVERRRPLGAAPPPLAPAARQPVSSAHRPALAPHPPGRRWGPLEARFAFYSTAARLMVVSCLPNVKCLAMHKVQPPAARGGRAGPAAQGAAKRGTGRYQTAAFPNAAHEGEPASGGAGGGQVLSYAHAPPYPARSPPGRRTCGVARARQGRSSEPGARWLARARAPGDGGEGARAPSAADRGEAGHGCAPMEGRGPARPGP